MTPEQFCHLDPTADAPRKARQWIYQALRLWDLDDPELVADVLTSELVTNAVRYAGSRELALHLVWELGRLRIEVEDDGAGSLKARDNDPRRGEGYGLLLVERLADTWGCERTPTGKRVWFELKTEGER